MNNKELNEIEKVQVEKYKKLLIERNEDFNNYRNNLLEEISSLNDTREILKLINDELLEHYKAKSEMLFYFFNNTTSENRLDEKMIFPLIEVYDAMLNFIEDQKMHFDKLLALETTDTSTSTIKKIKWHSSPSIFGYLFLELAKCGFIEFPLHNGEPNLTGLANQLLDHFEVNGSKQTIINELNPQKQSLSETKRAKFQIPQIADLK